ncbi:CBF/Mak21 family-domain-containing protein [Scheffersomyces coipomensis]|uniref:CBF/Mak21 family-domain-containing protein n=1 Tax=Scheffersomyces coipomensis TaxID=1788519 RepID=UPI00315CC345
MAVVKRKADSKSPKGKKVTKRQDTSKESNDKLLTIDSIQKYGNEVIDSSKYNNLVILLEQYQFLNDKLVNSKDVEIEKLGRQLSLTLFKSFQHLLKNDKLILKKHFEDNSKLIIKWLLNKYDSFKDIIFNLIEIKLSSHFQSIQLDLLEISLNLIKLESKYLKSSSNDLYFPITTYSKLINSLLLTQSGEILTDGSNNSFIVLEFLKFFTTNWDLQFYFFNNLSETLQEWKSSKDTNELRLVFSNFFTIIRNPLLYTNDFTPEDLSTWIESKLPSIAYKPSTFKSQYQKSILLILSYPLLTSQYKSILLILHKRIIPNMAQPQNIMDFLTDCYNINDDLIIPILTLNSLYELIKKYNLEYPEFYTKLYSLLTPELLYTHYRSRFFRLCDLFLSSTHLSANLVASFIKKLARLSMASTASGNVIVIPFTYNLLKRHPTCMIMLHNTEVANSDKEYKDPFNNNEKDPLKTNAIESSLWELEVLMSHYHPNIATLAKIFGEPFRKHSYNLEDFLDWSYISLLDNEKTRRYKTTVALEFEEFSNLFEIGKQDDSSNDEITNVYAKGWTL